jgi:tellurium resistance protein TerD
MPINLSKGQKVDLTKGNAGLDSILVGLGWDTNKYDGGHEFDLDVSIFMTGDSGKVENETNFVFYNNPQDAAGSVIYSGDNRTGEGEGDDESVKVTLSKVPDNVQKISFTVTIHEADARGQNFGQVSNAYIRIVDTAKNEELLRYDLGEDYSIETAIVVAELYRHNGEWKFAAVGSGFQGGLAALCRNFGLNV